MLSLCKLLRDKYSLAAVSNNLRWDFEIFFLLIVLLEIYFLLNLILKLLIIMDVKLVKRKRSSLKNPLYLKQQISSCSPALKGVHCSFVYGDI